MKRNSELVRIDPELKKILLELKADLSESRGSQVSFRETSKFLALRIKKKPKKDEVLNILS